MDWDLVFLGDSPFKYKTFRRKEDRELEWQASTGFVLETFLGPLFLGGSVSLQSGDGRFYVSLAPFVR